MVQIIEENRRPQKQKPPSMSDRFKNAFAHAVEVGSSTYAQRLESENKEKRRKEENEFIKELTGLDLEGIEDPETRKQIIASELQGKQNLQKFENQRKLQNEEYQLKGQLPQRESKPPLTGQAVPTEVSMAANKVIQQFPDASADQLKMMMDEIGIPPAYSNGYVENRRRQDERSAASKDKRLESGQKRAEKVLDKADRIGENLPLKESYVNAMEDSVLNEDLSFWSPDNLATITGIEALRSAKGAQFISAAKNYFIDDLKASGARPNMFIEKQLVDSLAKIGRSQEANQVVLESFKFKNDLDKNWLETVRSLEKQYDETIGYLPGSLSRIAEEMNKPYVEERQKQYESRLKELAIQEKMKSKKTTNKKESKPKIVDVLGPDGQLYEINSDELELLPEGYTLK